MTDREKIKMQVLNQVAGNQEPYPAGRTKYRVGRDVVHVRFCSRDKSGGPYKFNINSNILSADYELWTCGSANEYHLLPMSIVRSMYNDPYAYADRRHQGIDIVTVNVDTETATYAAVGKVLSLSSDSALHSPAVVGKVPNESFIRSARSGPAESGTEN